MDEQQDKKHNQPGKKFLTFKLAGEIYGLEILKVREIISVAEVTRVPRTPQYITGVFNLRGSIHPLLDLKKLFQLPETETTDESSIIVVEVKYNESDEQIGIIIDQVREVIAFRSDEIDETPDFGNNVESKYIIGMGKKEKQVSILLDIQEVINTVAEESEDN